uniref:CSON009393 protein n=1 Tax=Culicoides sonorensis TaxID=179676 RepID=A0A336KHG1_CULSO
MRVKLNSQMEPHSKFVEATTRMLYIIHRRLMSPIYSKEFIWKMTSLYKEQLNLVKFINEFINSIIEKRRNELISNTEKSHSKRLCLLDILLHSEMDGKPLTNEDIRGEVNTFMFAGHETSGGTLSFVMYLLAINPEAQNQLLDEIINANISFDTPLNTRKLNSLPFLDGVIKESLRIFPIFPLVPKKCIEDVKIGDVILPAETFIGITYGINHVDEKYFKNPNIFDPTRWFDEISNKDRNPYVYQPFSVGLRNCIGQKFALMELKTAIIKMILKFNVIMDVSGYNPNLIVAFSMKPTNGIPLKFIPRN